MTEDRRKEQKPVGINRRNLNDTGTFELMELWMDYHEKASEFSEVGQALYLRLKDIQEKVKAKT